MKTLRQVTLSVLAGVALLSPLAGASQANAHGPSGHGHRHTTSGHGHHQARIYTVYYRECCHDAWRIYASYHCPLSARQVARAISDRGYETFVR